MAITDFTVQGTSLEKDASVGVTMIRVCARFSDTG